MTKRAVENSIKKVYKRTQKILESLALHDSGTKPIKTENIEKLVVLELAKANKKT